MDFQIVKSLLIIKGQDTSLRSVETFLKNREWKIHSTNNLKDALLYLINNQPMFVLISIDHPNKKVQNLPRVLASAFPVCVIMFGESTAAASYKNLSTHPAEYKLFPPVSGPAVERIVNKYAKDQTQKSVEAQTRRREGGLQGEDESVIAIRGGSDGADVRSFSSANAQNLLKSLLEGGGDASGSEAAGHIAGSSNSTPGAAGHVGGGNSHADAAGHVGGGNSHADAAGQVSGGHGAKDRSGRLSGTNADQETQGHLSGNQSSDDKSKQGARSKSEEGSGGFLSGEDKNSKESNGEAKRETIRTGLKKQKGVGRGEELDGTSEGENAPNLNGKQDGADNGELNGENEGPHHKMGGLSDPSRSGVRPEPGSETGPRYNEEDFDDSSPIDLKPEDDQLNASSFERKPRKKHYSEKEDDPHFVSKKKDPRYIAGEDTLIIKGTEDALKNGSNYIEGDPATHKVENSTNVACIVIDSTRFSGYLVTAMGKDRQIDAEFIDKIRLRLFKFLMENGESLDENEKSMNIKIKQVDFQDWAVDCAEFLRKSIHKGDEVAMAFFPHQKAKTTTGDSAAQHMATINIEDINADVPLDFGVYVYLEKNQKYVLYTPQGGTLYSKQKEKLMAQGVKSLHVNRTDLQKITGHRAQTYLNGKIEEYTEKVSNEIKVAAAFANKSLKTPA